VVFHRIPLKKVTESGEGSEMVVVAGAETHPLKSVTEIVYVPAHCEVITAAVPPPGVQE
jgi:hypothetical protein